MLMMGETSWGQLGSSIAGLMLFCATLQQFCPHELRIALQQFLWATVQQFSFVQKWSERITSFFFPYMDIKFPEYFSHKYSHNEAFSAIESYLGSHITGKAKQLKATLAKNSRALVVSLDQREASDEFNGVKLWWALSTSKDEEIQYYQLTFHRKHRDIVTSKYIDHVVQQGKEMQAKKRLRKLYTNNPSDNWYGYQKKYMWSYVVFDHPSKFETLAMDPKQKEEIISDLIGFSEGKDYYEKIGKAWKRGYLLYGPPGTGKSSMIAAMANLLNYDVYDLELTTIKNNTELKRLLIETSSKSIIVIEDIDCSLELTGERNKRGEKRDKENGAAKDNKVNQSNDTSKITLSGLLNSVDGIWSSCGTERIIVFTTNHKDKLDPALIRRGRMDMHIEMSYCKFEAFKVLAMNYLNLESHEMFVRIHNLLDKIDVTPADVAEHLMSNAACDEKDVNGCLQRLIQALEAAIKTKEENTQETATKGKDDSEPEKCKSPTQVQKGASWFRFKNRTKKLSRNV